MDTSDERRVIPEWHVLGAGAIGGLFAGRMQSGGLRTSLILRHRKQLDDYHAGGLQIVKPDGSPAVPRMETPPAFTANELVPACIRQLLIATKAHQTQAAILEVAAALHSEVVIVLLQNGMGVCDSIKPLVPRCATLLQAITTEGVWRKGAFTSVHAGRGHTWIGSSSDQHATAATVAQQWRQAGIPASAEADIAPRLWRKLAVNCAINPFTALYQCRNGELPQHPEWSARRDRVLDEVIALAALSACIIAPEDIGREVDRVIAATAENHSSMLQDIRAGRPTEIEFMNGFVAQRSALAGLSAPENQALAEAVRLLAAPN